MKIKLVLIVVINMLPSAGHETAKIVTRLNELNLWGEHNEINPIILETYHQWQEL